MGVRRRAREVALQILYQMEVVEGSPEKVLESFWTLHPAAPEVRAYAERLARSTWERRELLDSLIAEASEHWSLGRMDLIALNILRFAACELMCFGEVPTKVVINEAVEVAKKYGTADAAPFING
ncbi:MAG: transcription antitermination factor NusB, partial [Nitrospinota bacterium]